ncbi:MAG: hypothetical protein N3I35_03470 [Clostridia bacterium]|nr:hypothetical protein [Clostridia bacterium]
MNLLNKKGAALVQVLLVLVVFSILITAFISVSTAEVFLGEGYNRETQAYFNARSGLDITLKLLQTTPPAVSFYLYGDLNNVTNIVSGDYISGANTAADNSAYVVYYHKVGGVTNIDSTGNVNGTRKFIKYIPPTTSGGAISPGVPPVGPGSAYDGGSASSDGVTWFDSDTGRLIADNTALTLPIILNHPSGLFKQEGYTITFKAPAAYFTEGTGIEIKKTLILIADFIYFSGPITLGPGNVNNTELILHINKSEIKGRDIGGIVNGPQYGVVYIGSTVQGTGTSPGYYYFQDGTDLLDPKPKQLIPISDISKVDFNSLHYTITTSEGSGGVFK